MAELNPTSIARPPVPTLPAKTQVLVVGGGPVGAALGIELTRRGVDVLVVEEADTIEQWPVKAMLLNPRTLEHFRRWGMAEAIRAAATTPVAWQRGLTLATSLTGSELGSFRNGFAFRATEESDRTAESAQVIMQPDTTQVLRATFERDGGHLALGWRVSALEQDGDGATVQIEHVATSLRQVVQCVYVVGCDGPASIVRRAAGIERTGRGGLAANLLLHWRSPQVLERSRLTPAAFTALYHPDGGALCVPIDAEHWCAHVAGYPVDVDITTVDVDSIVRRIVGPEVEFELVYAGVYKVHERIAERYRQGRFFIAGDAAHLYAPFGGHNMNSGLGDAVDLGWKLAAVLDGWAGEALLDSYTAERRPIAVTNAAEASGNVARFVAAGHSVTASMDVAHLDDPGVMAQTQRRAWGDALWSATKSQYLSDGICLDQRYESPVIVSDETVSEPWSSLALAVSSAPGHRAPHGWLADGDSLYDHFGPGFSLVVHEGGAASAEGFVSSATELGIPLSLVELTDPVLRARYEFPLTLVRPDQHVAWRGTPDVDSEAVLVAVTGRAVRIPKPAGPVELTAQADAATLL